MFLIVVPVYVAMMRTLSLIFCYAGAVRIVKAVLSHGFVINGTVTCKDGYTGPACDHPPKPSSECYFSACFHIGVIAFRSLTYVRALNRMCR